MNRWIIRLKNELAKPLPGEAFHALMAPSVRRDEKVKYPKRNSGVLLLLYPVNNIWHIVFMKRRHDGGPHSGQISFPGGREEAGDKSLIHTALREAYEETGITPEMVEVLGTLSPLHIPVSNNTVLPVVGYTKQTPAFKPDPAEVDYLIEAGLSILLMPQTAKKKFTVINKVKVTVPYYEIGNHHIWGATAMILGEFLEVVRRAGFGEKDDTEKPVT